LDSFVHAYNETFISEGVLRFNKRKAPLPGNYQGVDYSGGKTVGGGRDCKGGTSLFPEKNGEPVKGVGGSGEGKTLPETSPD